MSGRTRWTLIQKQNFPEDFFNFFPFFFVRKAKGLWYTHFYTHATQHVYHENVLICKVFFISARERTEQWHKFLLIFLIKRVASAASAISHVGAISRQFQLLQLQHAETFTPQGLFILFNIYFRLLQKNIKTVSFLRLFFSFCLVTKFLMLLSFCLLFFFSEMKAFQINFLISCCSTITSGLWFDNSEVFREIINNHNISNLV